MIAARPFPHCLTFREMLERYVGNMPPGRSGIIANLTPWSPPDSGGRGKAHAGRLINAPSSVPSSASRPFAKGPR